MDTRFCRLRSLVLALLLPVGAAAVAAQSPVQGGPGPAGGPRPAATPPVNPSADPLLRSFQWRSIGPLSMGGRVDEIAVVDKDPRVFYVGFATGGLWKTVNAGTTFEPVFETEPVSSIGAVAVSQADPRVVWVGTGEANSRQSASYGNGVYKSTDAGGTFTHMGLRDTQTIGRVVIHPRTADVVYIAAVGQLFGANSERGVFKTIDGGRTWKRVLYVDDNTGATDLVMDPSDPNILYAAMYQRRRTAWGYNGGGPGSGIWKTEDGGSKWTRLSGAGLPNGTMGRIGLDVSRSNPSVVYALIEVAADREGATQSTTTPPSRQPDDDEDAPARQPQEKDPQRTGTWRSADKGRTWEFRSNHNARPSYYSIIRVDPKNENVVYTGGTDFNRSEDGGRTFDVVPGSRFVHVDHHAIWIDPANSDHLLIGNDGAFDVTYDRGRTWESFRTIPVGQFYQVSVDMRRPYFVCGGLQDNGSWCGPSAVRAVAISGNDWFRVGGGDGFYSAIDPTDYNIIYSSGQNGNMRRSDLRTGEVIGQAAERVDAIYLAGASIQPRAPAKPNAAPNIVPPPPVGEAYRWNWNTPFLLSPHNPRVIYAGANRLFKSVNRGDTWTMGPDLTKQIDRGTLEIMGARGNLANCAQARGEPCILSKNDGVSAFGTLTTLAESPIVPGILWAGTDDGNVQVSRDGNATWTNVTANLRGAPENCYVSRVEASYFDAATAYVSLDCHRNNDLQPYVYVTRDFGRGWQSIAGGLPSFGNVNVVKQDPKNRSVLYAGTEFGFFITLDEGKTWAPFMTGLPTVRIDDVVVHPRDGDLVLGTHGRSVLVMDDVTPLQQFTAAVRDSDGHLFEPRSAVLWRVDARFATGTTGVKHFFGRNPEPGTAIHYYLKRPAQTPPKITVTDVVTGAKFRDLEGPGAAGINRVQWNLRGNAPARRPDAPAQARQQAPLATSGSYRITLTVDGREYSRVVVVEEDRWLNER